MTTRRFASDVAFSPTVKGVQTERGSRDAYARVEQNSGMETEVTPALRAFLAEIDTAFLATVSGEGQPYVQHRGGPKGFIRALDAHTLAFTDFTGNRQYITTGNLRDDARICLFLIDYAHRRRIKVWGSARTVSMTDQFRELLPPPGYRARVEQVVLITLEAWDVNCPQHIPQKLDAADVAEAIAALDARIATLEAENARLRAALR